MITRRWFVALMMALAALLSLQAAADEVKPEVALDSEGRALSGYDVVSYFSGEGPIEGLAEHAVEWNGATWLFASAEHRELFAADPERYAPQFGGYCAWAVTKGQTYKSDPRVYDIVDGRLYMNLNAGVQKKWMNDKAKNIAAGRNNWPDVLSAGTWNASTDGSSSDPGK